VRDDGEEFVLGIIEFAQLFVLLGQLGGSHFYGCFQLAVTFLNLSDSVFEQNEDADNANYANA
jgi:hypothetical protein